MRVLKVLMRLNKLIVVLTACGVGMAGCDGLRSVDSIVARGETQYANGNFRAALADFKTALERNPQNIKAQMRLAQATYFLGDFSGAQQAIDAVIAAGATDAAAIAFRFQVLLSRNQYETVINTVGDALVVSESRRLLFLAQAYAGLGNAEAAESTFGRSLLLAPNDAEILVAQARYFVTSGELERAARNVDTVLKSNNANASAWFVHGAILIARGDVSGAKAALEKSERLAKSQINWYEQARLFALLADVSLQLRNPDDAQHWVDAIGTRTPNSAIAYYMKARLALFRDNRNDAIAQLQRAVQVGEHLPSRLLLAGIQLQQANYGQAESQLNKLAFDYPGNVEVRKLLAQLYLATGRAAETQKVLSDSDDLATDPRLEWLRGETLLASGARDAGVALLEKSLTINPTDVGKALYLARAYIEIGAHDKAIALLESLPSDAGGAQRQGLLVIASVREKSLTDGRSSIEGLLKRYPQDSILHAAAGSALAQVGDTKRAIEVLNKAIYLNASNQEARMALASLLFKARQYDQAEQQLLAVTTADAKHVQARVGLASVALARGRKTEAVQLLEAVVGIDPAAIEPRLQLAQLALADQDYKRGASLLDQAVVTARRAPAVINAVGELLRQAGQYDDALSWFEQAAAAGNAQAKINAAVIQLAMGQKSEPRLKLESLTTNPVTQLQAVVILAHLDAQDGRVDAALGRIAGLRHGIVKEGILNELEGDVHAITKQYDKASASFDRAYQRAPSRQLVLKRYRVRMMTRQAGAIEPLQAWLQQIPSDLLVRKVLAKHYLSNHEYDSAIREYQAWLLYSLSRDPEMVNDLAWLYGERGDGRALALSREAYLAAPQTADIADTYGWLLLRADKLAEALPVLEKAALEGRNNPEIQYHHAFAQSRAGARASAQRLLKDLLSKNTPFASRADAERLLQILSN